MRLSEGLNSVSATDAGALGSNAERLPMATEVICKLNRRKTKGERKP